jgi:hypothetical protein
MDDRDHTDTNVVHLHRQAERDEAEREALARTIFADQDEIGTFSRGNLVPPTETDPQHEDSKPAADSFFDRYQAQDAGEHTATKGTADALEGTAAFFDEINARSAAEMVASPGPAPAVAAMPGSARLAAQLGQAARGRRNWRLLAIRAPRWRPVAGGRRARRVSRTIGARARTVADRLRSARPATPRLARSAVLAALGVVSVAGVALAVAVATSSSNSSIPRHVQQASVGSGEPAVPPTLAQSLHRSPTMSRRRTIKSRVAKRSTHPRARRTRRHATSAAARRSAPAARVVTVVSAPTSTTQAQSSSSSQPQTSPTPATPSGNGPTATQASGSSKQPAFGASGALGPGHSPDS